MKMWICPECEHNTSIAYWICDNCHFQVDENNFNKYKIVEIENKWSVSVNINGEDVLSISDNELSGVDLTEEQLEIIRNCARHLLGFAGESTSNFFEVDS